MKEKGKQSTQFSVQGVKKPFILFKCHRSLITIPMIFIFLSCREKARENKEFNREISKPRRES